MSLYPCYYLFIFSLFYKGSEVYNELIKAHSRGVHIRVVQSSPEGDYSDNDSYALANDGIIELRNINISALIGSGILHTKLWIVDGEHFYVGSANMDWRSLTQVSLFSTSPFSLILHLIMIRSKN